MVVNEEGPKYVLWLLEVWSCTRWSCLSFSFCYCSAGSVAMHSFSNIDDEDETGNLVFSES